MELYPEEAPALGFEKRTLDYVLTINQDGTLTDTFKTDEECVVSRPASNKTSAPVADVLWGDEKYMLNIVDNSILDEPGKHCNEIIKFNYTFYIRAINISYHIWFSYCNP